MDDWPCVDSSERHFKLVSVQVSYTHDWSIERREPRISSRNLEVPLMVTRRNAPKTSELQLSLGDPFDANAAAEATRRLPKTLSPGGMLHSSVVADILMQEFSLGVPH